MSGNDSINQNLLDKILKPAFEDNGRNLPELSNETIEKLKDYDFNTFMKFIEPQWTTPQAIEAICELGFLKPHALLINSKMHEIKGDVDYNNNQFHYLGAEQKRTTQKKADFMRRYLATHNDGCFTIVRKNLLCTFAHGTHGDKDTKGAGWKVGQKITDIRLFDGSCIDCEVKKVDSVLDCIWLKPSKDITIIDDIQIDLPFYNQEVVVLGLSGVNQIRHQELENIPNDHVRISYDICNVSCISLDEFNRLKTNKKSSPGESGGPIFDYWDGHLIGMMVGSESYPGEIKEDTGCVNQRASTQRDDSTILVTNFVKSVISLAESAGYGGKGSFISSYILATACNNP